MILTGKTLDNFLEWVYKEYDYKLYDLEKLFPSHLLYYLIIEWFDSVGIFINIKSKFGQRKQCERFSFNVENYNSGFLYNSRNEATKQAIIKANEIYNNLNK